ncbi:hsp70 nucleotide exchange factor FES1 [Syzygium oleosum]|uniref:hsp70 nucleotide exchange factor FES1 n=1 Tax=Syzygium oleosum TaxID=219896 RepID=UPI0024B983B2|nr:hsp70 nucleotide exchange factor FES1 [Syzygium oleosum]
MARFALRRRLLPLPLLVVVVAAVAAPVLAERVNRSASAGLFWSTAKEEADLVRMADPQEDPTAQAVNEQDGLDGGFSSLDGMLQWAIGHSDPEKLKERAQDVQRMSASDLKKRQMELKELMEKLKMPSDAQLMQIAIDDLKNSSLSLEDRHRALHELLILVEPIDNANDLPKIGGLAVVIRELDHPDPDVRKLSAWVLGKASQNNPLIQRQVLELGALAKLMMMVKSEFVEEAIKAFYAVSALIRNNLAGQQLFYAQAGDLMLQDILSNSSIDIRLRRKAVFLVGDLAERQLEALNEDELPFFRNEIFLKAVVDLLASTDLDLQEKALTAVKNLLHLRSTQALIFKEFCGLDAALERMRQQLQDLMAEEFQRDYATDVESLRREVELIYQWKLGKVMQVPT